MDKLPKLYLPSDTRQGFSLWDQPRVDDLKFLSVDVKWEEFAWIAGVGCVSVRCRWSKSGKLPKRRAMVSCTRGDTSHNARSDCTKTHVRIWDPANEGNCLTSDNWPVFHTRTNRISNPDPAPLLALIDEVGRLFGCSAEFTTTPLHHYG